MSDGIPGGTARRGGHGGADVGPPSPVHRRSEISTESEPEISDPSVQQVAQIIFVSSIEVWRSFVDCRVRDMGETASSSFNESFASSASMGVAGGRHASSDRTMTEEDEPPTHQRRISNEGPMRAQIRPGGAAPKSAGDKGSSSGVAFTFFSPVLSSVLAGVGSRIPRSRSLSSRRIRRTMSCNALPVIESVQEFPVGQEKANKKFAWHGAD